MRTSTFAAPLFLIALAALAQSDDPEPAIRRVLEEQQAAWNRGDVPAFMSGYEDSEATTFVGSTITKGRARILENYRKRYADRDQMGTLAFSDIEIRPLCPGYASVLGRWRLARSPEAGGNVGGIFTLLFRKTPAGWKIILDHTS